MKLKCRFILLLSFVLCLAGCGPSDADITHQNQESAERRKRDVQLGHDEGRPLGIDHARAGNGLPSDAAFRGIALARFDQSGAEDKEAYKEGLQKGFMAGFASVKTLPNRSGLRQLAWDDLSSGRELFGFNGEHEVTLVSADRSRGIITVRYPNGTVEEKRFDSLQSQWFTK